MGSMMALRAHARGGPEQLVYEPAPVPSAGPGEVLIAVHAAAITFAELTWDLEWTTRDGRDRTPVIPSHEMSGTVAGVGAGVAGLAPGDEVIGLVDFDRDGAAAEYVVMVCMSCPAPFSAEGLDWFAGMTPSGAAEYRAAATGRASLEAAFASAEFDPEVFTPADHAALFGPWLRPDDGHVSILDSSVMALDWVREHTAHR